MKGCKDHLDKPSIACGNCGDLAAAAIRTAREADHIMQFFDFAHLPEDRQAFSRPFHELAYQIVAQIPRNPERTVALRKLLEAKDAAVRAAFAKP